MTARFRATVLYEDSLAEGAKTFGPHALALACASDRLPQAASRHDLAKLFDAIPKKGKERLRHAICQDAGLLLARSERIVVMFDADHVRPAYSLAQTACKSETLAAIRRHAPSVSEVVLLEQNVESVVHACLVAQGRPVGRNKPNRAERDRILFRSCDGSRDERRLILERCPSFERLVSTISRLALQA